MHCNAVNMKIIVSQIVSFDYKFLRHFFVFLFVNLPTNRYAYIYFDTNILNELKVALRLYTSINLYLYLLLKRFSRQIVSHL